MDIFSIKKIKVLDDLAEIGIKAEGGRCPLATRDIAENLKNRQNCIDTAGYGPLNPKMANDSFWQAKADRWKVTIGESKKQLCGNCAAFIKTPRILECIEDGLGNEEGDTAWDVIEAGDLGYCEAFDFKCAASRTCDAWIVGGPITEEKGQKDYPFLEIDQKELDASEYIESLNDEEFDIMFPDDSEETMNEAKWLFDTTGGYLRRAISVKRKKRKTKDTPATTLYQEKAAKKPVLRDPKGGLTAAGRKYFARTEGLNLKPGVKGPADTPEKMRRKGSFLVRFFTNPRGPMVDEKGKPTRLALSAHAWGEPVPQTRAAALKLAAKGRRLLDKYRRLQKAQKKKALDSGNTISRKQLGKPVAGTSGTVGSRQQNQNNNAGQGAGGSSANSGVNYDPNAVDRDGDGTIQEGTDYARPTQTEEDKKKKKYERERGSADARERGAIRQNLSESGVDWNAFGRLMRDQVSRLKPGDKTNWNPGRLPNGGKIAADGTYVPPDMVREDDKRMSDYYRRRREARAAASRPKMTRDGDVIPDKNRDRRTTRQGASASTGSSARPNGDRDSSNVRPFGEGVRPFDEGVRPLGEGVRPLGEGVRPLGDGVRPFNEGVRPFNEGVRPLGEGVRPLGEGVRPFNEGKPPLFGNANNGRRNTGSNDQDSSSDGARRVSDWASNAMNTARQRSSQSTSPATRRTGSADAQERRAEGPRAQITDSGSADTRERGAIRDDLARRGFDGREFGKLMRDAEDNLEAGDDTNFNPGRLPGGGKISATGDYIPRDMVEEDDRRAGNFYRNRRENRPNEPRVTRDGTVVPDKNRDRRTPTTSNSGNPTARDGEVAPNKNRDRRTLPSSPATSRIGSADAQERRSGNSGARQISVTADGDVAPNKNTDKRTPPSKLPSSWDNFRK